MPAKSPQISLTHCTLLLLLAIVLACFYRLPYLEYRPLHVDEAILAWKSLEVWKTGIFDYDPSDYHGPALHYLAYAWNILGGWGTDISESQLRLLIALCGIAVLGVTVLMADGLGRSATVVATLLMAVSPMQVFYSRYYIMEMLLVLELALFMAACWRYTQGKNRLWLVMAGLLLGTMHATKETFLIHLIAMGCGWAAVQVGLGGFSPRVTGSRLSLGKGGLGSRKPWLWVLLPAVVTSVALYSGFSRWDELKESVSTYGNYLSRSAGAGGHEKAWWYYLKLLTWNKEGPLLWTELGTVLLAAVGGIHSLLGNFTKREHQQALRAFLTLYALAGLVGYSIIPYKTPWSILSIQWALIVLAGLGAQQIYASLSSGLLRFFLHVALAAGLYHLCEQSMLSIDVYRADVRNPYCYSHTSTQAVKLVERMRELRAFAPESFSAQVITTDHGWPLPWYLRAIEKVGYPKAMPQSMDATLIVADSEWLPQVELLLGGKPYVEEPFGMRPGKPVTLLVEKTLWDAQNAARIAKQRATAP